MRTFTSAIVGSIVGSVLLFATGGQATLVGTPSYSVGAPFGTDQFSYSIGFEFMPTTSFNVTALGNWDLLANGLNISHQVAIYKVSDQSVVASATVLPADAPPLGIDIGTDPGAYAYEALATPVLLQQGELYRIAANTYHGPTENSDFTRYDLLTSPPTYLAPMTLLRGAYYFSGESALVTDHFVRYPNLTDNTYFYSVPNFLFTIPEPEPSTAALLALGGLVVAWPRRRKTA